MRKNKQKILDEIQALLHTQTEALKGELDPLKAVEYNNRNQHIRELLQTLYADDSNLPRST